LCPVLRLGDFRRHGAAKAGQNRSMASMIGALLVRARVSEVRLTIDAK
jgi:hypothetical protein